MRRLGAVVLVALLLGSLPAAAATAPPSAAVRVPVASVGVNGGGVTVSLRIGRTKTCLFQSAPAVAKFRATVSCTGKTVRRVLHVPPLAGGRARVFNVTITVVGSGGKVVRHEQVHQSTSATTLGASRWWVPPQRANWQWELDHPLNLSNPTDMGIGDTTSTGGPAPTPTIYDIDGFDNSSATVTALHERGDRAICYIEVGAAENYRSDYSKFSASDLGASVPGYSSERYLNINSANVISIIEQRIAMCASKGFDAIEPDIDDSYTDKTGFSITEAQNVAYDTTLANFAHSLGVGFGLKNGDNPDGFATRLLPSIDFVIDEQCFEYTSCSAFYPAFKQANKAVFEVEYVDQGAPAQSTYCPTALADGFNAVLLDTSLNGKVRVPCG